MRNWSRMFTYRPSWVRPRWTYSADVWEVAGLLGACVASLAAFPVVGASPAGASSPAGVVEVVRPPSVGGGRLTFGGSTSRFTLKLPEGAACAKDSFDGEYRVSTYMVPVADDPMTLTFASQGPSGAGRHPLYDVTTRPYVNAVTAKAEPRGGPGPLVAPPIFNFGVYAPGELAPGSYNFGLACTLFGKADRYWNGKIAITVDPSDKPAAVAWKIDGAPKQATGGAGNMLALAGVVGVGVIGIGGASAIRRKRRKA